jgi:glycosyltransferase involved in cell wall biosynthesis
MTGRPTVTVVIPSRDRPVMARRAVACAIAQIGVDVDVVLVDDGSRVPLEESLDDLCTRLGDRLTIVRNETSVGVAEARNRGIQRARGRWTGFCDDDDIWAPVKVREQLATAGSETTWTVTAAMAVDEGQMPLEAMKAPPSGDILPMVLSHNVLPGGASSVIALTEVVQRIGGFDTSFSTLADWDFWVRLAQEGPIGSVHRPLVGYLVHTGGMSNDTKLLERDMDELERKYRRQREELGVSLDRRIWHRYIARMHLRAERRIAAARALAVVATESGERRKWKGVAGALLSPRQLHLRREAIERGNIPPSWAVEFASWFPLVADGGNPLDLWPNEASLPPELRQVGLPELREFPGDEWRSAPRAPRTDGSTTYLDASLSGRTAQYNAVKPDGSETEARSSSFGYKR